MSQRYGGSPFNFLIAMYPDYPWQEWKFIKAPKGYWDIDENQIKFVKWAEIALSIKETSDWYNVATNVPKTNKKQFLFQKDFKKIGGISILKRFGSLYALLNKIYPDFDWLPWKFTRTPKGYWEDPANQKLWIDWATKKLNIKEMSDWYKITMKVLKICVFFCKI